MQKELIIALLAGFGGMIGWGLADFFAKKTVDRIGVIASLVFAHIFGVLTLLIFSVFQWTISGTFIHIPSSSWVWLGLIFFGVLQMVVYWLVYEGFGKGQVAVLSPVFASFTGLVALISIVFLGESASVFKILSLLVMFTGIILINADVSALHLGKISWGRVPGFKEVAMATILAAVWTLGWDRFVAGAPWLSYALCMYVFMTMAAFILSWIMKVKLSVAEAGIWKFLALIGFGEAVAYSAISLGYSSTSLVSVVALLSGAFSLPVIILARIFLKEKVNPVQTVGSIIIVAGIIFLSLL